MKAIVTVIGKDQVGIIAGVCTMLASHNINVDDISQTVMESYFAMMMMVDTSNCSVSFEKLSEELNAWGKDRDLTIRIQRTDLFEAMHRI